MNLFFKLNPYVEKQQKNLITYDRPVGSSPVLDNIYFEVKTSLLMTDLCVSPKRRSEYRAKRVFMQCTLRHPNS